MEEMKQEPAMTEALQPVPEETTLSVLQGLREELQAQGKHAKKQVGLLRACLFVMALIALIAVLVCVTLVPPLYETVVAANGVIAAVDTKKLTEVVENVQKVSEESTAVVLDAGDALQKVNALDFAALNATILDLEKTVDGFAAIDIPKLNEAINNLNETAEPFAKFFSKFK